MVKVKQKGEQLSSPPLSLAPSQFSVSFLCSKNPPPIGEGKKEAPNGHHNNPLYIMQKNGDMLLAE